MRISQFMNDKGMLSCVPGVKFEEEGRRKILVN